MTYTIDEINDIFSLFARNCTYSEITQFVKKEFGKNISSRTIARLKKDFLAFDSEFSQSISPAKTHVTLEQLRHCCFALGIKNPYKGSWNEAYKKLVDFLYELKPDESHAQKTHETASSQQI